MRYWTKTKGDTQTQETSKLMHSDLFYTEKKC